MFLPDTNVWIELIKGRNTVIANRWRGVAAEDVCLCSIVKAELWHGACKYQNPDQRHAIVEVWIEPYVSFPFDDAAARRYADIRHHLELQGKIIGPNDLKIAAICLAHDLTLVSANISEFRRVPGLKVEDWTAA